MVAFDLIDEIYFDECYHTNPLVNAMSVGIVKIGKTISATALGKGNPVFFVGSATGKDGIGGASFASANITKESVQELPAVQVGDPFQEKKLLEACLEVIQTGALVGMQDMARRAAPLLSGGQQQRVALARAVVRRPSLLLLDEPLSNLDARLREAMRRELAALIRRIGCTALFVTHDQVEALSLADRVAVMNGGRILQEGTPVEVYGRPKSLFVARFLGAANRLGGRVAARTPAGELRVRLDCNGRTLTLAGEGDVGEAVDVVLRPEDLTLAAATPADNAEAVPGTIVSAAFQGAGIDYEIDVGGALLRILSPAPAQFATGAPVWVAVARSGGAVFRRDGP